MRRSRPSAVCRATDSRREVGVAEDQVVAVAHGAQRAEHLGVQQRIDPLEHVSPPSVLFLSAAATARPSLPCSAASKCTPSSGLDAITCAGVEKAAAVAAGDAGVGRRPAAATSSPRRRRSRRGSPPRGPAAGRRAGPPAAPARGRCSCGGCSGRAAPTDSAISTGGTGEALLEVVGAEHQHHDVDRPVALEDRRAARRSRSCARPRPGRDRRWCARAAPPRRTASPAPSSAASTPGQRSAGPKRPMSSSVSIGTVPWVFEVAVDQDHPLGHRRHSPSAAGSRTL